MCEYTALLVVITMKNNTAWMTLLVCMALVRPSHAALELANAEALALTREPTLLMLQAKEASLRDSAIADGQLPDPQLKLGLMNFPTDSFDAGQEPMTQLQLGVRQMFPAGNTLEFKQQRTSHMADANGAQLLDQTEKVRRELRKAWYETFYWVAAGRVLDSNMALFEQLVGITRLRYAAGGKNQQDVIRAELELEMLKDRQIRNYTKEEAARAGLGRWVGSQAAAEQLPAILPELPTLNDRSVMLTRLQKHPSIGMQNDLLSAAQKSVAMARESYKPKWMLDLTYGKRNGDNMDGSPRADFASAMVMVDLPLFTAKRQDKRLSASLQKQDVVLQQRETRYRELTSQLDRHYANWQRLGERLKGYEYQLIPKSESNSEAALNAYQSDRGDFTMLMRARITELDTRLAALRLQVDRAKTQAELLYLAGEEE